MPAHSKPEHTPRRKKPPDLMKKTRVALQYVSIQKMQKTKFSVEGPLHKPHFTELYKRTEIEILSYFADFDPKDFLPVNQLLNK